MSELRDFEQLVNGIKNQIVQKAIDLNDFISFYEKALIFMELRRILPENDFTKRRMNYVGRNLAMTIFFAMYNMYEEAQILLRQIIDLLYIILYGANHILDLPLLDEGKMDQVGNIRKDVNRKLPSDAESSLKRLYRKLSSVVHGTIRDILSQVNSVNEPWENPAKLGHWKHDFHETLDLLACLCRSWLPESYATLDIGLRAELEKTFPRLVNAQMN